MINPLVELIPEVLRQDPKWVAICEAVQPYVRVVENRIYLDMEDLPDDQLNTIAWQFGVQRWSNTWPRDIKLNVLNQFFQEQRELGTRESVMKAVRKLGSTAVLTEWWETTPKGDPYTFMVEIAYADILGQDPTLTQADVIKQIDESKPVRSSYALIITTRFKGNIKVFGTLRSYERISLVAKEV